jgi:hypothetical protein
MFSVDNEMIFADYIFVLSEFRRAVDAIRNEYALQHYSTEYELLRSEKESVVRNKIPVRLMEIDENR